MKNNQKKKIIFIVNIDSFFISHRLPVAEELIKIGYEVHLATEFTKYKRKISKIGIKTHHVDFNRNSLNIFFALKAIFQIFLIIFKEKPKILHLVSLKPIIFGGLIPFFCHINLVVLSITGLGSMFIKKNLIYNLRLRVINFFYRLVFLNSNLAVILQNNDDFKYLAENANLKKKKVKFIRGSGVDFKTFKYSKIPKKKMIILMASRIIEDKGVMEFLKAAKELKNKNFKGKFYLVGDFDKQNPSAIDRTVLDHFKRRKIITYFKHQKKIFHFIKKSTLVVLPSYREGFPKILMEASAVGRPIIATNVPGCKDVVIKNKTGILIPPKNYSKLAKEIFSLSKDRKKILKLGFNARQYAVKSFNIKLIVSKHISIYKNMKM